MADHDWRTMDPSWDTYTTRGPRSQDAYRDRSSDYEAPASPPAADPMLQQRRGGGLNPVARYQGAPGYHGGEYRGRNPGEPPRSPERGPAYGQQSPPARYRGRSERYSEVMGRSRDALNPQIAGQASQLPYYPRGASLRGPDRPVDHRGRGPRGYQRSAESIMEDLCERLTDHPHIDASDIEIEIDEGIVTLKGRIRDRRMKKLAEHVADGVNGVRDVRNQLEFL